MQFLTESQLQKSAPSIFATEPHQGVSDRYGFVPTIDVVRALAREDWHPVLAKQTSVRDATRKDVTRHMLRFRKRDRLLDVDDTLLELVLTNSHDRTSCYQLDLGVFRLVCLNGMVASMGDLASIRVRHSKNSVGEIIEGSYELIDELPKLEESIGSYSATRLDEREQDLFCRTALEIRYGENWETKSPIAPEKLNQARRPEDVGDDLWRTMNRTQENLLKGNIRGRSSSGRRTRTRPVNSVVEDVRLNRALWRLAERFNQLKNEDLSLQTAA